MNKKNIIKIEIAFWGKEERAIRKFGMKFLKKIGVIL